ncbi:MAG TPA: HAD family hydrolase [Gaiellaceae bacterium]|nr:HAD family hydrolase [Gaiellaceae bacterium]
MTSLRPGPCNLRSRPPLEGCGNITEGVDELALDTVATHWRQALDDAEDALDDLSQSARALGLPPAELRRRLRELRAERAKTDLDLQRLARTTHFAVHRRLTGPRATSALLGLGPGVRGCVFDLDGVLTPTAELHVAAWQESLDELIARHVSSTAPLDAARPFSPAADYGRYLFGRPRLAGVHAFLASRGIRLPDGSPDDPAGADTAYGVANRKNELLGARLRHEGVRAYDESLFFLELAHEAKLGCAVVSASANTNPILERAGLRFLVDVIVDGTVMQAEQLRPKPAPDSVLEACARLGLPPAEVATFETTAAGVAAGRAAGVERVVLVRREGVGASADRQADRVVADLGELIAVDLA